MADATCLDVLSGKMSKETTKCNYPAQSILGEVHENKQSELVQHTEASQQTDNADSNPVVEPGSVVTEPLEPVAGKNTGENSVISSSDVIRSCQMEKNSIKGCPLGTEAKQEDPLCSGVLHDVPIKMSSSDGISTECLKPRLENEENINGVTQLESVDVAQISSLEQFETPPKQVVKKARPSGRRDKRASKSRTKTYTLRSSSACERVLRSKVQEKPKPLESVSNVDAGSNGTKKKKEGKLKEEAAKVVNNEFAAIRKNLKYFLKRINYEQNLIDAYSFEGWRGNSLEKLKPEKELQRATSEILRRKLQIRDLFQQLDLVCAEGRFPNSLFDSEGQIDSEDIFCAKCGSDDVAVDNDIILCDGACDRGFHQFCLEPPLLIEDIPTEEDGWLCPGCDCKVDCVDLLNDSQGTNLSVTDSWEKVFPEASRDGKDDDPQLSSDDSEDDDYDPDRPETVEKLGGSGSGSDNSEAPNKSEHDLGLSSDDSEDDDFDPDAPQVAQSEQNVGLSSDDSEDDEFDPDAPDLDDDVERKISSSDFSSEDLNAVLGNEFSENHEPHIPSSVPKRNSKRRGSKSSLNDELLGMPDSSLGQDGSSPISAKREVERLDYKRLYDETYGNIDTDSSADEEWNDSTAPRRRKKINVSSVTQRGSTEGIKNGNVDNEVTPKTTPRKSSVNDTSDSQGKSRNDTSKSDTTSGGAKSSTSRRLGEAVIQRMYKSFQENQYPDRATKEKLAEELGIRFQQVDKWFGNARWSVRHPPKNKEDAVSKDGGPETNKSSLEQEENSQIPTIATLGKRRGRTVIEKPQSASVEKPHAARGKKRGRR